jgi:hypothetical protein
MQKKSGKSDGNDADRAWHIAVIGVKGSGKTTLAAGLVASSREDFTVIPDDDTTRTYLGKVKSQLQDGRWPEETNKEKRPPKLLLSINQGQGRVRKIFTDEYKGELVLDDPEFINNIVGEPDGAIILFNPGMDILSNSQTRNKMVWKYAEIIRHLHAHGCRHVVFAVTASDRLGAQGDLAPKKDEIKAYEREITNYLDLVGDKSWWVRMNISVTGPLASQTTAKLGPNEENTASEPFKYLITCLNDDEARMKAAARMKKVLVRTALIGLVAGIALAGIIIYMRYAERQTFLSERQSLERNIAAAAEFVPSASSDLERARALKEDIEKRLRELSANKPQFPANLPLWVKTTNDWTSLKEKRTVDYLDKKIHADWHAFNDGAATCATESAVQEFAENLKSWKPGSPEAESGRNDLLAHFPDKAVTWRTQFLVRQLDNACKKADLLSRNVQNLLADSLSLPMTNGCSAEVYGKMKRNLFEARKRLLAAGVDFHAVKAWNPEDESMCPEEWETVSFKSGNDDARLATVLTAEEKAETKKGLAARRDAAKAAWYDKQAEYATAFLSKIRDLSASDACVEYGSFCSEHPKNPGLAKEKGNVRAALLSKVKEAFDGYWEHFIHEFVNRNRIYNTDGGQDQRVEEAERRFSEFKVLCELLKANGGQTLSDTPFYRFAVEAAPELRKGMREAFLRQLTITKCEIAFLSTKIETGTKLHTGVNVTIKLVNKSGTKMSEELIVEKKHYDYKSFCGADWNPCFEERRCVVFNAWMEPSFWVEIEDCCPVSNGCQSLGIVLEDFRPAPNQEADLFGCPFVFDYGGKKNSTELRLRVYGEISGQGFVDLYKKYFGREEEVDE